MKQGRWTVAGGKMALASNLHGAAARNFNTLHCTKCTVIQSGIEI
jgi:hypothetical protein